MKNLPIKSSPEVYCDDTRCLYITTQNVKFEHKFDSNNRMGEFEVFLQSIHTSLLLSGDIQEASKVFPAAFANYNKLNQ